jgi:hypothetical protein
MDAPASPRAASRVGGFDVGGRLRRALRFATREPLVHFALLAALIFGGSALVTARRDDAQRRIVVDQARVRQLSARFEAQMGSPPTEAQQNALIEDYVQEEIRFREAKRLGLDQDDEIVRRRLASKFDFLQADVPAARAPTSAELERFYASHGADFAESARVTFTHVYFSPDRDGSDAARVRAEKVLATLVTTPATRAPELGDRFALQTDFGHVSRLDVVQTFGDASLADAIFSAPVGRWMGPLRSGYGWHLAYVSARDAEHVPPLGQIRDKVVAAYLSSASDAARRDRDGAVERRYVVERRY